MYKKFTPIFIILLLFSSSGQAEDHKEHIEGPFSSPQEITETCLMCHEEIGEDILKTRHWNWLGTEFEVAGHGSMRFGKLNMINNFCIAVPSNWPRCTSCHISYGWKDASFDFTDPNNIDCLVCHDQTGTYKKIPTGAGMPFDNVDLVKVAQSVGNSTRKNCGYCHFDGGGGNGVKHGDLDENLLKPSTELDVHMGGQDFSCTECHITENHEIQGASHGSIAQGVNHIGCIECHDTEPHEKEKLNKHSGAVACQTCHIPTFGRGNPTKIWWDWSTAGKDTVLPKDKFGKDTYDKKKGTFKWAENVIPDYLWFNGKADYYQIGDKIDAKNVVQLNDLNGNISDASAKIYPFKPMRGKQIYDKNNNYLIVPKLFGENGFWKTWDWQLASTEGMKTVELDYSGGYDFVETNLYIPIHHTVAPKEKALRCYHCHHKTKSVLDWKTLGYEKDPMSQGGREKNGLIK